MAVATRGIEREIASLQMEARDIILKEKKLVAEIKKTAKIGNEAATKILARQLVCLRQQITNLQGSRAQIRGVATHTQALYANTSISTGMKGATKAMFAMNKEMAPAKQAKVIKSFQKESAQLDMTIEMMSESIDETLDKDEVEEETEELTNQVLDEIGVGIASQLKWREQIKSCSQRLDQLSLNYQHGLQEGFTSDEGESARTQSCLSFEYLEHSQPWGREPLTDKSSLGKLGRKLSMQRSDVKEIRDHQPSSYFDELAHASKDMQDMRNCYDGLLFAAAATANSIYEFSESLNEMGNCLLEKTAADADAESGKVLSTLGNMQLELQKIADTYRSYVVMTITNPSESLLSELRKVEEMKLQCDEKREVYEYMISQHKEKGKLRSGKAESSIAKKLQEAQDEYEEVTRLCVFRVKSLKEGQWRSLLTQAARHHAAQMNFFRKGLKAVEAVEPFIRNVAEKLRIDYHLSELHDRESREGEPTSGYESTDDGELSFDYRQKKQGFDDDNTSPNPMELDQVDVPYFQASNLDDSESINPNKHKGDQFFGRQTRVSSYSAPLFPEKVDPSERPKETHPPQKFHSYVLPPPVTDTRNPISKPSTSVSQSIPFQNVQNMIKDSNRTSSSSVQLPTPSSGRFSFSQKDTHKTDSKEAKRQSYSGPLPPSKQFSFKISSNNSSGPIPQPGSRVPTLSSNVARSVSPPPISSPKISELHELPRPPTNSAFSKPVVISGGLNRHSAPLLVKNQEISLPNKRAMLMSTCASPLPLPPSVKIPSSNSGAG